MIYRTVFRTSNISVKRNTQKPSTFTTYAIIIYIITAEEGQKNPQ